MIKAKVTIFDDKRNIKFVEDKVITSVYNHRLDEDKKSYKFEFSLNVYEPSDEAIEQKEETKEENVESEDKKWLK